MTDARRAGGFGVWLVALGVLAGCGENPSAPTAPGATPTAASPPVVRVRAVHSVTLEDRIAFSGTVAPSRKAMISPKILGAIETITKQEGDAVAAGEVLVRLERADYELGLRQAQATLALAEANLAKARQAVRSTRRPRDRLRHLRDADSLPDGALDEIDGTYQMAVKTVGVARANVAMAKVGVEAAERQLSYTEVTSPYTGVVLKRLVDEGELARALPPTVVLVVAEIPPFYVLGSVNEVEGVRLRAGTRLTVHPDAAPGAVVEATVTQAGALVDPETRGVPIRALVTRGGEHLRVGLSAELVAQMGRQERLVVPRVALMKRTGTSAEVYVVRDAQAERRRVTLGGPHGDGMLVEAGLEAGDEVVVSGHPDVVAGEPLRVLRDPAPAHRPDGAVARGATR